MRIFFAFSAIFLFALSAFAKPHEGFARAVFLSYEKRPTHIYENQIFPITIKAMVGRDDFETLETEFFSSVSIRILNPNVQWQKFNDTTYYATYYAKALNKQIFLPRVRVSLIQDEITVESEFLEPESINTITLNHDATSCGVVGKNLYVKRFKTSRFDANKLIMVLEIEGDEANLEDFHIQGVRKQGLDSTVGEHPSQTIFYFIVFDDHRTNINFRYFNLEKNRFERIDLPVILDEDDLSTQIGLNPKESPFNLYKDITTGVLILVLLLLFVVRKKYLYLLLALALGLYFVYTKYPFSKLQIASETHLRIVPTEKSTIFHTTNKPILAEQLGKKESYIKVLLPTGEIGWIKEENVLTH